MEGGLPSGEEAGSCDVTVREAVFEADEVGPGLLRVGGVALDFDDEEASVGEFDELQLPGEPTLCPLPGGEGHAGPV